MWACVYVATVQPYWFTSRVLLATRFDVVALCLKIGFGFELWRVGAMRTLLGVELGCKKLMNRKYWCFSLLESFCYKLALFCG